MEKSKERGKGAKKNEEGKLKSERRVPQIRNKLMKQQRE